MTCVGERADGDWRRSLLDLGAGAVGGMKLMEVRVLERIRLLVAVLVMMLEELEEVEVVAVGVHRRLEKGAEAAVVEGLALLEEVEEAAVVVLARRYELTILSSDSHARPPSTSRHCPGLDGTMPFEFCFDDGLAVYLPLADRFSPDLELDLQSAAPVDHARTLLHAPWPQPAASQVL